ncbi:putative 26S proteasome non-ATPase regulatory subunit 3 [Aphis craccivora]|uniref:Putative 26S proteasome non-ATPase regulatory subunit 3 n=1 Tax=Aphis craccivora TaxID=307492 RepID=A0A6G0Z451_APHCR|nr:putative 26S proteasome non-ATPase regulatory subunit 3 [Aphis craccivora]
MLLPAIDGYIRLLVLVQLIDIKNYTKAVEFSHLLMYFRNKQIVEYITSTLFQQKIGINFVFNGLSDVTDLLI